MEYTKIAPSETPYTITETTYPWPKKQERVTKPFNWESFKKFLLK